eukprot:CAMPEP_0185750270 /NCGR_PEP_ID=MMETSP1174-20130828/9035_1 /TAXON_ID=35687 /ORGANISM="Dictyocha speculum, Strain CCMP1381" /LENGTH=217 /DNA_ID=CAMNT_0028426759 /DNA_START=88 /DNA_END=741 /DNA_ORIENTATION=+
MSKRKAWDDAIKQVAKEIGTDIGGNREETKKRETRRRVNARKWIATSDKDDLRRKVEARLEALEEAQEADFVGEEDDEWQDEEQVESRGRKSKIKAVKKLKGSRAASKKSDITKRFRPRSLAQVLLEEHGTVPGNRLPPYISAEAGPSKRPSRSLCAVTGAIAKYRDPSSGLPFAGLSQISVLKDTPPPWLQLSGNAPYFESIRMIRKECENDPQGV